MFWGPKNHVRRSVMKGFKQGITLAAVVIAVVLASFVGRFFFPADVGIVEVSQFSDAKDAEPELATTLGLQW
jgi:hypothetical protein